MLSNQSLELIYDVLLHLLLNNFNRHLPVGKRRIQTPNFNLLSLYLQLLNTNKHL